MLIDDLVSMDFPRLKAREHLDELMAKPLVDNRTEDEKLRETWGTEPEAIAMQDDDFWERRTLS